MSNPDHDAVVIGTGFGGAVAACRLAQANLNVAVLERGRRYPLGSFPRDLDNLDRGWLWSRGQGLFDVRPLNDVLVVQAAGYGGGSLVYANVQYRPPADVFAQVWPAEYSRQTLDPYYDLVAYMLDVTPVSAAQPLGLPPKSELMQRVAKDLGRRDQFFLPNLAVNFGTPGQPQPNKFGVNQSGCIHCGECDVGCNVHAKNTLDLNYLAVAEQRGAVVRTRCEVTHISRADDGYVVHFIDHEGGGDEQLTAPHVFVCAGAVNSTELLLRSRDQHRALPDLSEHLGSRYSANGDFLAFAFDTSPQGYFPSRGPTITTATVFDDRNGTDRTWFVFEDGGYPRLIANLLQLLDPSRSLFSHAEALWDEVRGATKHEIDNVVKNLAEATDHAGVFLVMGRDRANGSIRFLPALNGIRIRWDLPSNLPLYVEESAFCTDVANAMGGRYVPNPGWKYLSQPVSVHNLGGCPMGASAANGVVDAFGEVFGYPGLHVLDGAILPTAVGANPSHTIAAVAERSIEHVIRGITGQQDWSAPEGGPARAHPWSLPEDKITIPAGGTSPTRTPTVGLSFTETMQGTLQVIPATSTPGAIPAAASAPPGGNRSPADLKASFRLTISTPDLDMFLADPTHPAAASGTVWVDGHTRPQGDHVVGGVFNLFTYADSFYRRKMLYWLPFYDPDGRHLVLQGYKEVWDHGQFDVWGSTTTLYTSLIDAGVPNHPTLARGVLTVNLPMFARQLSTLRITGTTSPWTQLRALSSFSRVFVGTLVDVFVRSKLGR